MALVALGVQVMSNTKEYVEVSFGLKTFPCDTRSRVEFKCLTTAMLFVEALKKSREDYFYTISNMNDAKND